MCGRFALPIPFNKVMDHFLVRSELAVPPRYNIAPTQETIVIRQKSLTTMEITPMRWGLIPGWAKSAEIGAKLINARSETLAGKPSFRTAYKTRRCLIPASGFFEWQQQGNRKQPYYIGLKGGKLFAMAGLWESWRDPAEKIVLSFTIITTEANSFVTRIHERMPVIIDREQYGLWLNPTTDTTILSQILKPWSSMMMTSWPVSTMVNNPKNDAPGCLVKIGSEGLPT
ncbi:MAG: SOS response-associated peptidase [Proteobacteria bacterium]|nr:SOS response-associated peptidase [Pseudomonadota bacterium]MBU1688834.1 SOS response-associated peptidase [Pseudomonadota bacterium]